LRKQVCCIRCGIRLHPSDWEILKYNNQLPICDECDIKYSNEDMKAEGSTIVTNGN
jgi:NAD-dependent SIR2 family protein deacetylase